VRQPILKMAQICAIFAPLQVLKILVWRDSIPSLGTKKAAFSG